MIVMEGFQIFRLDREKGNIRNKKGKPKRGGGLVFFVKKELCKFTSILEEYSSITENIEQLWIQIEKPNTRKQIFSNIYRPPDGKIKEGLESLTNIVKKVTDSYNGELTIMGDFNVNYNLRHTAAFKLIKDFEREFNLTQLIQGTTRHGNKNKSCLDLIFTNMDHIISQGILKIAISDHFPVFMIKKKRKESKSFETVKGRSYAKYVKQDFQNDVKNHPNWENFWKIENNDSDELWEVMLQIIKESADIHCPYKNMKIREETPNWINNEILAELHHKDYLFSKAKRLNTEESWNLFRDKKNEVKKASCHSQRKLCKRQTRGL